MKKYLVESTCENEGTAFDYPVYKNAAGGYLYAKSEAEALETYKNFCISQGMSEEEIESADYTVKRVVPSYDEVSLAWFAEGYHADDFETIGNFINWLKAGDMLLTPEEIDYYFSHLQEERAGGIEAIEAATNDLDLSDLSFHDRVALVKVFNDVRKSRISL